jgi:cytochrome c biogenesis protein CcmG/thiol:disulfide interchange protein DsbE
VPRRRSARFAGYGTAIGTSLLLAGLLGYGLLVQTPSDSIDDSLRRGNAVPAPGFDVPVLAAGRPGAALEQKLRPALRDGRVSLRELAGTPLLLNLWASWCQPCRAEADHLEQVWTESARPHDVLLIGLNTQDLTGDAIQFLHRYRIDYPTLRDKGDDVSRHFHVTGLPETFAIDRHGRIVAHIIGSASLEQLRNAVRAADNGRPAAAAACGDQGSLR